MLIDFDETVIRLDGQPLALAKPLRSASTPARDLDGLSARQRARSGGGWSVVRRYLRSAPGIGR